MQRRNPAYFDMPPEGVWERAQGIRLLATDVDGVLTDGSVYVGAGGEALKAFHIHDGKGLRMLQDAGIEVAWISARSGPALESRAAELGITRLHSGAGRKGELLTALCADVGISTAQAAYVGDDLVDLAAMAIAGLSVAVADAHPTLRQRADWVTTRPGGRGAVREVCELLLASQGRLDGMIEGHE